MDPYVRLLLRHHHADHRGADGDQGLQLGADALARRHPPDAADAVRARLHRHLPQRRADRALPRQRRRRRAALRHHVRGRAFPHGDGRGADPGDLRRDLPLVSRRSPAGCSTRRWAGSTSGSPSSAPTRSSSRCTTSGWSACRGATSSSATRPSSPRRSTGSTPSSASPRSSSASRSSCSCSTSSGASATAGRPAAIPGGAASLEWQTPETPPGHGNWGRELPIVYRWAYDYSVPGAPQRLHRPGRSLAAAPARWPA